MVLYSFQLPAEVESETNDKDNNNEPESSTQEMDQNKVIDNKDSDDISNQQVNILHLFHQFAASFQATSALCQHEYSTSVGQRNAGCPTPHKSRRLGTVVTIEYRSYRPTYETVNAEADRSPPISTSLSYQLILAY